MATIGLLFPLSGPIAASGEECVNGSRIALEAAGHTAVVADAAEGDVALTARRLVERDGATVVVGTLLSALALPASAAAADAGALFVEAAAVADELGQRGLPLFVRPAARAAAFGERAASFAVDAVLPAAGGRAAVLYEGSAFGRSLGAAAIARLRSAGIPLAEEIEVPAGSVDLADAARRIARADPHVLFAACYTATAQALWRALLAAPARAFATIGVGGGWLHLGEGAGTPDPDGVFVVDVAPSLSLRAAGLVADVRSSRDRYGAAYRERHGAEPTLYSDLGHVACSLLATAIERAGSAAPDRVAAAFRKLDVPDGRTLLGYGVRMDAAGENVRAAPVIMQWHGRELRVVHPRALATADPRTPNDVGAPA